MVPRLEPVGRFEIDGTGGGAGAAGAPWRPAGGACCAPAAKVPSATMARTAYILLVIALPLLLLTAEGA